MAGFFGSFFNKEKKFQEGDYFFVKLDNQYLVYKVLRIHEDTLHILTFEPSSELPKFTNKDSFNVLAWHAPIAKSGFPQPSIIGNAPISLEELKGYHVYLKETGWVEGQVIEAQRFYQDGLKEHDNGEFEAAIKHYTAAVKVFPMFFEAIDNMGFGYMSLGNWNAAAQSFEESVSVNPDGFAAIFSLGECNMRLENYDLAVSLFERAAKLDPANTSIKTFQRLAKEKRPHPDWIKK